MAISRTNRMSKKCREVYNYSSEYGMLRNATDRMSKKGPEVKQIE